MNADPLKSLPQNEWDALINSILRPYIGYYKKDPLISVQDLQQEAWIALLKAAKTYDPTKAKFTTFAHYHIRGRILRYISEKTRVAENRIDADITESEVGYVDTTIDDDELMQSMLGKIAEEPHSKLLIEHFINGKSYRDIAKQYGMSHQNVAMHIGKLIRLMEKRLSHENA